MSEFVATLMFIFLGTGAVVATQDTLGNLIIKTTFVTSSIFHHIIFVIKI